MSFLNFFRSIPKDVTYIVGDESIVLKLRVSPYEFDLIYLHGDITDKQLDVLCRTAKAATTYADVDCYIDDTGLYFEVTYPHKRIESLLYELASKYDGIDVYSYPVTSSTKFFVSQDLNFERYDWYDKARPKYSMFDIDSQETLAKNANKELSGELVMFKNNYETLEDSTGSLIRNRLKIELTPIVELWK